MKKQRAKQRKIQQAADLITNTPLGVVIVSLLIIILLAITFSIKVQSLQTSHDMAAISASPTEISPTETPTHTPTPTYHPTYQAPTRQVTPTPSDNQPWGVAKQISQHSYTMKVGQDSTMATSQEIFVALNNYRSKKGVGSLSWNGTLASYAQSRADLFNKNGTTDEHAGFTAYMNAGGDKQLGFSELGENDSIGYTMQGVHLIEWIYASDAGHDANQLRSGYTDVGIGVSGTATDLIFGGGKM